MDTDRVILLLKERQKATHVVRNLNRADPVSDSMGISYMGMTIELGREQFATIRPHVIDGLKELIRAIDDELGEQGVTIK